MNIAIISTSFHVKEMKIMKDEAINEAKKNNLNIELNLDLVGSLEIPLILDLVLQKNNIDGVVVLGIIERGETKHGLVMGQVVTKSIIDLQVKYSKPVGVGILGPEIEKEQMGSRLVPYAGAAVKALKDQLSIIASLK